MKERVEERLRYTYRRRYEFPVNFFVLSCVNFWDEAWFLSLRVFRLLSSSLFLCPPVFFRCFFQTQKPTRNFELCSLLNPWGSPVLISLAITGYKCSCVVTRLLSGLNLQSSDDCLLWRDFYETSTRPTQNTKSFQLLYVFQLQWLHKATLFLSSEIIPAFDFSEFASSPFVTLTAFRYLSFLILASLVQLSPLYLSNLGHLVQGQCTVWRYV